MKEMIKYIQENKHSFVSDFEFEKCLKYARQIMIDNAVLPQADVRQRSEQLSDFERWAKLNAKNMHDIDYWIAEYRYQKSLNCA